MVPFVLVIPSQETSGGASLHVSDGLHVPCRDAPDPLPGIALDFVGFRQRRGQSDRFHALFWEQQRSNPDGLVIATGEVSDRKACDVGAGWHFDEQHQFTVDEGKLQAMQLSARLFDPCSQLLRVAEGMGIHRSLHNACPSFRGERFLQEVKRHLVFLSFLHGSSSAGSRSFLPFSKHENREHEGRESEQHRL